MAPMIVKVVLLLAFALGTTTRGFQIVVKQPHQPPPLSAQLFSSKTQRNNNRLAISAVLYSSSSNRETRSDDGQVGSGPNWLERSFPLDSAKIDAKAVEDYNLGLNGISWQVGPLSLRMYDAMTERSTALDRADAVTAEEILRTLKVYALDFTAKEAVRAALKQNGLELVLTPEEEDVGMWGDVEAIQLINEQTGEPVGPFYDDWETAVDFWTPGQPFNFVVRQVPSKLRELSVEDLLQALDPEGKLRNEAQEMGITNLLPESSDINSLADMAAENKRRTEDSPQAAVPEHQAFGGNESKRGYQVIAAEDLAACLPSNTKIEGLLESKALLHVMDALVSHGCLVVDVTNGGKNLEAAQKLANMWKTTEKLFAMDQPDELPQLQTASETGSSHAKIGYASYNDGNMQFLETRLSRETGELLPSEMQSVLGAEACQSLQEAFQVIVNVGKDIVRVTMAASTLEAMAESPGSIPKDFDVIEAANRVADELVDDGLPLSSTTTSRPLPLSPEGAVSMTPHRLCRYSNHVQNSTTSAAASAREVFGAHTDSTFVTLVPVAAVSGLEVYDEAAEQWYRPELAARRHYDQQKAPKNDDDLPWHARYLVAMPGEFLQLLTRQEILAAVHRVVAVTGQTRYSAPVLLRGRSNMMIDATRYWGKASTPLLRECNGKSMEEIHKAMQT